MFLYTSGNRWVLFANLLQATLIKNILMYTNGTRNNVTDKIWQIKNQ